MIYILLIIGLIIIYIALKKGIGQNFLYESNFNNKLFSEEINSIKNEFKELSNRIEDIENSIIILNEKLENSKEKIYEEEKVHEIKNISEKIETEEKDLNSIIYNLYDEGLSIDEICSRLKIGKGEALLRIGLRKQK
ncbi:hypothetical protein SAMN05443428_10795 [Caloramator quimbayensis]|uniref:DUF2802 domain-containing protein n=1 Tax=Caloramator quimbayensis TaxID=1147123 RepID=A0A1T4XAA1_9CLOT|nr:hypothetical protein [Caloramator quimbayensis]SKA86506.1 hypothetical protein SAMN05443428_10795 [Caloramator quimbayensis]